MEADPKEVYDLPFPDREDQVEVDDIPASSMMQLLRRLGIRSRSLQLQSSIEISGRVTGSAR